ncbi:MAG: DNA starvation/stationary phase protection protein [Alphaproteobacteria bacterium]|nr:DNA starvation/stationary phase protection protein [Alphaproteobacteria bacterium]
MPSSKIAISKTAELLSVFLADHFTLYVKTQNFHWHLKDPLFASMHPFLGTLYKDLLDFIDPLGERLLTLGLHAPASMADFLRLTQICESKAESNLEMIVSTLIADHTKMIETAEKIRLTASADHDAVTDDMMIERIAYHQKTLWTLRSVTKS